MRFCCLKNCKNRENDKSLSFFLVKERWSEFLATYGDEKWRTRRRSFLCSKHFGAKLTDPEPTPPDQEDSAVLYYSSFEALYAGDEN